MGRDLRELGRRGRPLATASLFIVNPLAGAGGLMELFSTHPPLAERVSRLHAMAWRGKGLAA